MKWKDNIRRRLGSWPLQFLFRLAFGGLFIYASLDKIAHPAAFAEIVDSYSLLPAALVHLAAAVLPWVELLAGAALVAGIWPRGAALLLVLLLGIFIAAIAFNAVRGLDMSCGCFSTSASDKENPWLLLGRDFLFLLPGLLILFFGPAASDRERPKPS